jgi:CBS domain-containing protein
MDDKLVGEVMHKGTVTCSPDTSLQEVVRILSDADVRAIVVVGADYSAQGIISHMDIMAHYGENLAERHATDVMTREIVSVTPQTPLAEAVKLMVERRIHRLLVAEATSSGLMPVGILSTTDVIRDIRGSAWAWRWD